MCGIGRERAAADLPRVPAASTLQGLLRTWRLNEIADALEKDDALLLPIRSDEPNVRVRLLSALLSKFFSVVPTAIISETDGGLDPDGLVKWGAAAGLWLPGDVSVVAGTAGAWAIWSAIETLVDLVKVASDKTVHRPYGALMDSLVGTQLHALVGKDSPSLNAQLQTLQPLVVAGKHREAGSSVSCERLEDELEKTLSLVDQHHSQLDTKPTARSSADEIKSVAVGLVKLQHAAEQFLFNYRTEVEPWDFPAPPPLSGPANLIVGLSSHPTDSEDVEVSDFGPACAHTAKHTAKLHQLQVGIQRLFQLQATLQIFPTGFAKVTRPRDY